MDKIEDELQKERRKLEYEVERRLKNESVDTILQAMFSSEITERLKIDPVLRCVYENLRQTMRRNIELEKQLRGLK